MKKSVIFLSVVLLFLGCSALMGEEVGRLKINALSIEKNKNLIVKETSLHLKKDDEIAIWSDIDVEYEGDIDLIFRIGIDRNGEEYGGLEINPMDKSITIGEFKTSINNKTNWSFVGKNSKIKIEEDGEYTFKGLLVSSDNPSLKITKAEIVLKK
ncbi:hypothetical protein [uncultured Algibacter sp.]|uniref:hypothetical protein n=1 Tax=uncultured Algibacter sp. TaxID=298659 RepID=UPI003217D69C